jgi:hypothetical protein
MGTLEVRASNKTRGLSRAGLNNERVNFVTGSVINNMATSLSRYGLLSDSCPNEPCASVAPSESVSTHPDSARSRGRTH